MELWDLYDKDENVLPIKKYRGDKLEDNEYHIVVNAWIKNSNAEYLITQRVATKSHPLMWECTGGSALAGETSLQAAIREVKEELGIDVSKASYKLLGKTIRYFKNCPDILYVYVFDFDVDISKVTIQQEEVNDVMWADFDKIIQLYKSNKFENNAFFEEALSYLNNEQFYYIGFNSNNAICNEKFFDGTISLNPTAEKGNIFYSKEYIADRKSKDFLDSYKEYISNNVRKIIKENNNTSFITFNKKIRELCKDLKGIKIVELNDNNTIDFLNDKFKVRELLKFVAPSPAYYFELGNNINYDDICQKINSKKFVVQAPVGSGGENTYLIENAEDIIKCNLEKDIKYSISKYLNNLPLNITMIIGENNTINLPISIQLIKVTDNKFKYCGGDFNVDSYLSEELKTKLVNLSYKICEEVKKTGYRGILGIDYLYTIDNELLFMELNPRFQSSSFLINLYLEKYYDTNIAKLHYYATQGYKLRSFDNLKINESFVNCGNENDFSQIKEDYKILNGYYKPNTSSVYRKVCKRSILNEDKFEKNREE